jgi:NAD dependent epimerase/dehydratase family enzyme
MNAKPDVMVSASAIDAWKPRRRSPNGGERAGNDFWRNLKIGSEALRAEISYAGCDHAVWNYFGKTGARCRDDAPFVGVGGRVGKAQWMSWVALETSLNCPLRHRQSRIARSRTWWCEPVTNAEFAKQLARAMHHPALFPAPAFALRLTMGEMADALLLASQRVVPNSLLKVGYRFSSSNLGATLIRILGKAA